MVDRTANRTTRAAAPAALALFVVIGVALSDQPAAVALGGGALAVLVGVLLAVLQLEDWALVSGLGIAAAAVVVVCSADPANLGWFAVCVIVGWAALTAVTPAMCVLSGALVVTFAAEWLLVSDEPGWGAWIAGTVFTAIACALARRQRELVDQLRAAQAGLADRARAEERNRIAREMHDVIGHALTVSLLHVSSARLALDEDPDEARRCLDEAERLAQQSLAEVRAAVSLMPGPHASGVTPMPGFDRIEALVESFRRAGTTVSYEIVGEMGPRTASEGLAVYRILQESLTNVARHAPGSAARIRVELAPERTRVVVDSDGVTGRTTSDGTGVSGMRERAESLGGALTAGPCRSGWRVEAVLPA